MISPPAPPPCKQASPHLGQTSSPELKYTGWRCTPVTVNLGKVLPWSSPGIAHPEADPPKTRCIQILLYVLVNTSTLPEIHQLFEWIIMSGPPVPLNHGLSQLKPCQVVLSLIQRVKPMDGGPFHVEFRQLDLHFLRCTLHCTSN